MSDPNFWLFADGSCGSGSNEIGAWTALAIGRQWRKALYGVAHPTTISRCELTPLIEGLRFIRGTLPPLANGVTVRVYSDSEYTIRTLSGDYPGKKNEDLWRAMDVVRQGLNIEWRYRQRNTHPCMLFCDAVCSQLRRDAKAAVSAMLGPNYDPLKIADNLPVWTMPEEKDTAFGIDPEAAAGETPANRISGSCGRMHEECEYCALQNVVPPACSGHRQGPVACEQFKPKGTTAP